MELQAFCLFTGVLIKPCMEKSKYHSYPSLESQTNRTSTTTFFRFSYSGIVGSSSAVIRPGSMILESGVRKRKELSDLCMIPSDVGYFVYARDTRIRELWAPESEQSLPGPQMSYRQIRSGKGERFNRNKTCDTAKQRSGSAR